MTKYGNFLWRKFGIGVFPKHWPSGFGVSLDSLPRIYLSIYRLAISIPLPYKIWRGLKKFCYYFCHKLCRKCMVGKMKGVIIEGENCIFHIGD